MLVRLFFARKRIVSPFRRFVPYNIIVVVCHFHCTILNNKIYTFLLPALSIQFSSCPSLLPTLLQNLLSLFSLVDRMWLSFSTLSRLSSIPLCSLVQLIQHLQHFIIVLTFPFHSYCLAQVYLSPMCVRLCSFV